MSADDGFDVDRLAALVETVSDHLTTLKRAIVDPEEDHDLLEILDDLWEVLDEVEDVLGTIDFEEVPDAIDIDDLPDAVEVDDVPSAILNEEETAIDLANVREAVDLRELGDAVNLTRFLDEKQELDAEVDDLKGDFGDADDESDDGFFDDDDDGDDELIEGNVVGMDEGVGARIESTLGEELIQESIKEAVEQFRAALLATHEGLRKLYEINQEKLGQPGRQPDSRNPTAFSTMAPGPLPDSASTRVSTVPSRVRHSRVSTPRRIYGRRFAEATDGGADGRGDQDASEGADADE